jgi:hypothetical protein
MPIQPPPQPSRPVAWALLSQSIWLPLLAIDLHDRWQSGVRDLLPPGGPAPSRMASEGLDNARPGGLPPLPGMPAPLKGSPRAERVSTGLLLGSGSPALSRRGETISSAVESPSTSSLSSPASFGQARFRAGAGSDPILSLAMTSASNPADRLASLRGGYSRAELLGGPITLADLTNEGTVPSLALAEQGRRALSADPFAALPEGWREPMRRALLALPAPDGSTPRIEKARHVHVPARRISAPAEVPLALQSDGSIDILSRPKEPAVIEEIRDWSASQRPPSAGGVAPALVHLHPVAEEIPQRPSAADLDPTPIETPPAEAVAEPATPVSASVEAAAAPVAEAIPLDALGGEQP